MKFAYPVSAIAIVLASATLLAADSNPVGDEVIAAQRAALAAETAGKGYGPQSPRDLNTLTGNNKRSFAAAPAYTEMNLCNIHFHEGARTFRRKLYHLYRQRGWQRLRHRICL